MAVIMVNSDRRTRIQILETSFSRLGFAGQLCRPIPIFLGFCLLVAVLPAIAQTTLPDGPGKEQVQRVCTACHTIDTVTSHHKTRSEWQATLEDMATRGAQGSDKDFMEILNYLSKNFAPVSSSAAPATDTAKPAPVHPAVSSPSAEPKQAPDAAAKVPDAVVKTPEADGKVNVNKATASELASQLKLPDESAFAIVRYRVTHGAIKNWEELQAIPGLDANKLQQEKDRLEF
jgi:competence ComEA-like helix-hairpin-helix protein